MSSIDNIFVNDNDWSAEFHSSPSGTMDFRIGDEDILSLKGVSFGECQESLGISKYVRKHEYETLKGGKIDTSTILPFGSEPSIVRNFDYFHSRFKVVTEISLNGSIDMDSLAIDSIEIPGDYAKIEILDYDSSGKINIQSLPSDLPDFMMKWDRIPLAILLSKADGFTLEIGAGDDLWRWNQKYMGEMSPEFLLFRSEGKLHFRRKILNFPEKTEIKARNFKFTWFFAWSEKTVANGKKARMRKTIPVETAALASDMPESCFRSLNGDPEKDLCFRSDAVWARLKKIIRQSASENSLFLISGFSPGLCDNASHLDRHKKISVLHWDSSALYDFHLWSSKFLSGYNSRIKIVSGNPLFDSLPSIKSLY